MTQEVGRRLVGGEWVTNIADESGGGGGLPSGWTQDPGSGLVDTGGQDFTAYNIIANLVTAEIATNGDSIQTGGGQIDTASGGISTGGGALDMGGGAIDMNGGAINNLLDPSGDQDAATKKYVDDNISAPFTPLQGRYSGLVDDVANAASAPYAWTFDEGTALLDLTDPTEPAFLASGTYAITVSCLCTEPLTANGAAGFTLVVESFAQRQSSPVPVDGVPLVVVMNAVSGHSLTLGVGNQDGAAARDFTFDARIVRLA